MSFFQLNIMNYVACCFQTSGHSLQKFVETANDSKRKADDLFGDIDDIDFDEDRKFPLQFTLFCS